MKRIKIEKFEGLTPLVTTRSITCPKCGTPGRKLKGWVGAYYECGANLVRGKFYDPEGECRSAREKSALRNRIKQLEYALKVEKRRRKKQNVYLKNWASLNYELDQEFGFK